MPWVGALLLVGCGGGDLTGPTTTVEGAVRCNADGRREVRSKGAWLPTDFVCTTNVAIDDEIGSICATKADGRHRCWDPQGAPFATTPLRDADYVRVQLAREGAVGLTRDGRMHAVWVSVPPELPPIASFRATNLWGYQGMCLRGTGGELVYGSNRAEVAPELTVSSPWYSEAGPFGSCPTATPGNDWKQVTISLLMNCGLTASDNVRCGHPSVGSDRPFPLFAPGPYRQVVATYDAACALRPDGELVCQRHDNVTIAAPPGPFVSIEAGRDLLCGIRPDGTSSCFRESGIFPIELSATGGGGTAFVPLAPAIDADW
jgi:hypothetical protein